MALNIDLYAPRSWRDLSQSQLKYVLSLIAFGCGFEEIKTYCLFRWNKMEVLEKHGTDYLLQKDGKQFYASAMIIQSATDELKFLEEIPAYPVCLHRIRKFKAVNENFEEVPFKKYIMCDNFYQGYMYTKKDELLDEMARILYNANGLVCNATERIAVFYWWSSLKNYFAREFPHFFQTAGALPSDIGKAVKSAMNTQIRALTKGDVTKEKEILSIDTLRALNELNALALEYEEIERKYPSKK